MKTVSVLTGDKYLFQKIKLALIGRADVISDDTGDIRIVDIDYGFAPRDGDVTASRSSDCDLHIPFPLNALESLFSENGPLLTVREQERCAVLRGEKIKLTEVEYALFSVLMRRKGEFASREDILVEVWGAEADPGIINVYVHYLREKLERGGEKIIVSSRKMGYKIDGKYLGGNECLE